jgi:hypothetical protein
MSEPIDPTEDRMNDASPDRTRQLLLPLLALALFTLIVYGRVTTFVFFHDDLYLARPLAQWGFLDHSPTGYYWRPLWTLWMCLQYQVFGLRPAPMHMSSLVLHFANCTLACLLLLRAGVRQTVALAAVALWSVMAGNAFVVAWISQCDDLLALLFLLLATHVWVFAPSGRSASPARSALASLLWLASMLCKEIGFAWPIGAIVFEVIRTRRAGSRRPAGGAKVLALALPIVVGLGYLALRFVALGRTGGFDTSDLPDQGTHLHASSLPVLVAGRAVHYLEALLYGFLPLDFFRSWTSLFLGAAVALALAAALVTSGRRWWRAARVSVVPALAWIAMFSLHGAVSPHPRTLYIPTLGMAFLVTQSVAAAGWLQRGSPAVLLLAGYLGMQVMLDQQSLDMHSPSSDTTLIHTSQLLLGSDPRITPEKKAYLQHQLRYEHPELLTAQTADAERNAKWRTFLFSVFNRLTHHRPAGR